MFKSISKKSLEFFIRKHGKESFKLTDQEDLFTLILEDILDRYKYHFDEKITSLEKELLELKRRYKNHVDSYKHFEREDARIRALLNEVIDYVYKNDLNKE